MLTDDFYLGYAELEAAPGNAEAEMRRLASKSAQEEQRILTAIATSRERAAQRARQLDDSLRTLTRDCGTAGVSASPAPASGREPEFGKVAAGLQGLHGIMARIAELMRRLDTLRSNRDRTLEEIRREKALADRGAQGAELDRQVFLPLFILAGLIVLTGSYAPLFMIGYGVLGWHGIKRLIKGPSERLARALRERPVLVHSQEAQRAYLGQQIWSMGAGASAAAVAVSVAAHVLTNSLVLQGMYGAEGLWGLIGFGTLLLMSRRKLPQ